MVLFLSLNGKSILLLRDGVGGYCYKRGRDCLYDYNPIICHTSQPPMILEKSNWLVVGLTIQFARPTRLVYYPVGAPGDEN